MEGESPRPTPPHQGEARGPQELVGGWNASREPCILRTRCSPPGACDGRDGGEDGGDDDVGDGNMRGRRDQRRRRRWGGGAGKRRGILRPKGDVITLSSEAGRPDNVSETFHNPQVSVSPGLRWKHARRLTIT